MEGVHKLLFRVENHESHNQRSALKLEVGLALDSDCIDSSEVREEVHEEEGHCRQMDV